ncbi:MAG TPA: histidine kinase [Saprospiraceae bacterium]|nr:histidine kinase [Saprospiraceae bacterium]
MNRKSILLAIILFWVIFAALILAEDSIASAISKMKYDPLDRLQYIIRFAIWTALTPLIMWIAIRMPVRHASIPVLVLKHFLIALGFIALEFSVEIPIIRAITAYQRGTVDPVLDYAAVFIYKLNIYFLLYFFIVVMTYLVVYFTSLSKSELDAREAEIKNQQLQVQLGEAKLHLLQMQLDPHFLFNTHHSIISLMMNQENDKAIRMLTRLSDMLRLSLEERHQTIPLEKEIQILRLYLDIQQVRFEDRLRVHFDIEPATLVLRVPSFILQPLVENAIKYGIAATSHPGSIRIYSRLADDQFIIGVENEGSPVEWKNFRPGIGIANTKERLNQLYAARAAFSLQNLPDRKVSATITLPLRP